MELKYKIVETAGYLFTKYGVRSVSMDDIARELSVSKKTIYQHYKEKDEIVLLATQLHMEAEKKEYNEIFDVASNAIEELAMISKCMRKNMAELNPSLLYDLKKYHRKAWEGYLAFKDEFIRDNIKRNIIRGIKEGHYREEMNAEIISICRMEQIQMAFDDRLFSTKEFDFKEVHVQMFDLFVNGIVTDKGRRLYQKYLLQQQPNN